MAKPTTRRAGVTMRAALEDPELLGTVLAGDSWRAWRILLIAAMGEALTDDERMIFHEAHRSRQRAWRALFDLACRRRKARR